MMIRDDDVEEDMGVHMMILKWALKKQNAVICPGLIWLATGINNGMLYVWNRTSRLPKRGEFVHVCDW
jgi:hypothetical protein